jgi:hypothetical protein
MSAKKGSFQCADCNKKPYAYFKTLENHGRKEHEWSDEHVEALKNVADGNLVDDNVSMLGEESTQSQLDSVASELESLQDEVGEMHGKMDLMLEVSCILRFFAVYLD